MINYIKELYEGRDVPQGLRDFFEEASISEKGLIISLLFENKKYRRGHKLFQSLSRLEKREVLKSLVSDGRIPDVYRLIKRLKQNEQAYVAPAGVTLDFDPTDLIEVDDYEPIFNPNY